jgi:hypothetical protein
VFGTEAEVDGLEEIGPRCDAIRVTGGAGEALEPALAASRVGERTSSGSVDENSWGEPSVFRTGIQNRGVPSPEGKAILQDANTLSWLDQKKGASQSPR